MLFSSRLDPAGTALHQLLTSELTKADRELRVVHDDIEMRRLQGEAQAYEKLLKYLTEPLPIKG